MADTNRIGIDFDGTLADPITLNPIAGGIQAIETMREMGFDPFIFTANPQIHIITQWCKLYGIGDIEITNIKHPALAYIDDRNVAFDGNWEAIIDILKKSA